MLKDVSKYLFKCDPNKVDMSYLEDFDRIKDHLESCVELGLGISGLVNKLTTFIAALAHCNPSCDSLDKLKKYRTMKSSEKAAALKRKLASPTQ